VEDRGLKAIGARLRQSATDAGFSSDALAEQLGNTGGAVRGWWVGRNQIPLDLLVDYARLVGRSLAYLITGTEAEGAAVTIPAAQWAKLAPEDQQAIRLQVRTWARLRDLEAALPTAPTTDE
jgi:transcriptional regulator with XRE-family HTH domain